MIYLLVEQLCSQALAFLAKFVEPALTIAAVVNVPACAAYALACVDSLQSVHHSGRVGSDRVVDMSQLLECIVDPEN